MRQAFLILLLFLVPAVPAAALEGLRPGGEAKVVSVVDGDTVVLDRAIDGATQVRLTGIQAPKLALGRPNFKDWPLAAEARKELEALTLGRPVRLFHGPQRMDRHGRLLAHLVGPDGLWLQGEMLKRGLARVYTFADNRDRAAEMYRLEREAREAKRGIWALPYYAVRGTDPKALDRDRDTFQVIEGRIADAALARGVLYLNFGANWRDDFTARVGKDALKLFRAAGLGPEDFRDRRVRVRGWLRERNGPMIDLSHPEQIEFLEK